MKLSMWNLADWLYRYNIQCHIQEGLDTIRTVRWLAGDRIESDVVYVCRNSAQLMLGGNADDAYIVHRHDINLIDSSDTDSIYNEIINAIDYYNL